MYDRINYQGGVIRAPVSSLDRAQAWAWARPEKKKSQTKNFDQKHFLCFRLAESTQTN